MSQTTDAATIIKKRDLAQSLSTPDSPQRASEAFESTKNSLTDLKLKIKGILAVSCELLLGFWPVWAFLFKLNGTIPLELVVSFCYVAMCCWKGIYSTGKLNLKVLSQTSIQMIQTLVVTEEEGVRSPVRWREIPYRSQNILEHDELEEREFTVLQRDFWEAYSKKKKLGEGTTGIVYKCKEVSTGKSFAVKCVRTRDEEMIFLVKHSASSRNLIWWKNVSEIIDFVNFNGS